MSCRKFKLMTSKKIAEPLENVLKMVHEKFSKSSIKFQSKKLSSLK